MGLFHRGADARRRAGDLGRSSSRTDKPLPCRQPKPPWYRITPPTGPLTSSNGRSSRSSRWGPRSSSGVRSPRSGARLRPDLHAQQHVRVRYEYRRHRSELRPAADRRRRSAGSRAPWPVGVRRRPRSAPRTATTATGFVRLYLANGQADRQVSGRTPPRRARPWSCEARGCTSPARSSRSAAEPLGGGAGEPDHGAADAAFNVPFTSPQNGGGLNGPQDRRDARRLQARGDRQLQPGGRSAPEPDRDHRPDDEPTQPLSVADGPVPLLHPQHDHHVVLAGVLHVHARHRHLPGWSVLRDRDDRCLPGEPTVRLRESMGAHGHGTGQLPRGSTGPAGTRSGASAATGAAVYAGGHPRWMNNPYRSNQAGPGAVRAKGSPVWTRSTACRSRGTPAVRGAWGPSTSSAHPMACSSVATPISSAARPAARSRSSRWRAGRWSRRTSRTASRTTSTGSTSDVFVHAPCVRRHDAGPPTTLDTGVNWTTARGAFALNGLLYTGRSNGTLTRRSFDGTTSAPSNTSTSTGSRSPGGGFLIPGTTTPVPGFNTHLASMTGMFFDNGRIYYTVSGNPRLYYRYFTPESQVVGANLFVGSSHGDVDWSNVRGMTMASGNLYYALANGNLFRVAWTGGPRRSAGRRSAAPASTGSTGRPEVCSPSPVRRTLKAPPAGPAHGGEHRVRLDRPHLGGLCGPEPADHVPDLPRR